jgi:hypothetical protein
MMWDNRPDSTGTLETCLGAVVTGRYDASRSRVYSGYEAASAEVLLVGDSYTHGDEVGDDETIAAHLFARHGIRAANLGVGGYSPLQATLKARKSLGNFPKARIVVLGIMYENIRRIVNLTAITINPNVGWNLGIRPYALPDTIRFVPPSAYADLVGFQGICYPFSRYRFLA